MDKATMLYVIYVRIKELDERCAHRQVAHNIERRNIHNGKKYSKDRMNILQNYFRMGVRVKLKRTKIWMSGFYGLSTFSGLFETEIYF